MLEYADEMPVMLKSVAAEPLAPAVYHGFEPVGVTGVTPLLVAVIAHPGMRVYAPAQSGVAAPALVNTCPIAPTAVRAIADADEYATFPLLAVRLAFVPPFAMGSNPETSVVRLTAE